jgi:hypothetical protein
MFHLVCKNTHPKKLLLVMSVKRHVMSQFPPITKMCIFAGAVKRVASTKILVYETEAGSQITVYENLVEVDKKSSGNNGTSLPITNPSHDLTVSI